MSLYAAKASGTGTAGAASAVLADENIGRTSIEVSNTHATQILYLQLATVRGTAPTAVVGEGVRVNAAGGVWRSSFKGAIASIASGASTTYSIVEY